MVPDPERSLLQAILRRAIDDALGGYNLFKNDSPQIIVEARRWIFTAQDEHLAPPFSFVWCCEQLGVDVDRVRKFVRNPRAARDSDGQVRIATMPRYRVSR